LREKAQPISGPVLTGTIARFTSGGWILGPTKTACLSKRARLNITWIKPDLKEELGEYFDNPPTELWLKERGLTFKTPDALIEFLSGGSLVALDRKDLIGADNMTLDETDFRRELEDSDYAQSFNEMEELLKREQEMQAIDE
jgi:hypothetical protein